MGFLDMLFRKKSNAQKELGEAIKKHDEEQARRALTSAPKLVNRRGEKGRTPLHECYDQYVAEVLVEYGADVTIKDDGGMTPLHYASMTFSSNHLARFLLAKGAEVNARSNDGRTPLHLVNIDEVAELLLENGADVTATRTRGTSRGGWTPLHSAADTYRSGDVIDVLLAHGADVHARSEQRMTPLHLAAARWHVSNVETLIAAQAPVDIKNGLGRTPLEEAMRELDFGEDKELQRDNGLIRRARIVSILRDAGKKAGEPSAVMSLSVGEYERLTEGKKCYTCGVLLKNRALEFYDHSAGWDVDEFASKQWLYIVCANGHKVSLEKLGIPKV